MEHSATTAYLAIDDGHYEALIQRLMLAVKKHNPEFSKENDAALREYIATGISRGIAFDDAVLQRLAFLSHAQLLQETNAIPDKLKPENRELFAEAAERRSEQAQWNTLFPEGVNEIYLELSSDAQSMGERIDAYLAQLNKAATENYEHAHAHENEAVAKGTLDPMRRKAGRDISQRQMRVAIEKVAFLETYDAQKKQWGNGLTEKEFLKLYPTYPSFDAFDAQQHNHHAELYAANASHDSNDRLVKFQHSQVRFREKEFTIVESFDPVKKRWGKEQSLGRFLEERHQWALLDDFERENNRQGGIKDATDQHKVSADDYLCTKAKPSADLYDPQSLRVLISRDPRKIGEMSSGQHWESCMGETQHGQPGVNFHYVPHDIEAGTLVAYVVSKNDPQARYPLMRQLLKPYINQQTGQTVLIPAVIYGGDLGGNSFTRQALQETLTTFVREKVNKGAAGEFIMDRRLYGDGQPTLVNFQKEWTRETIKQSLIRFHDSSLQEWGVELHNAEQNIVELTARLEEYQSISMADHYVADVEKELKKAQQDILNFQKKINTLQNPLEFSKKFYRALRKITPDTLPDPEATLEVASFPEMKARAGAIRAAIATGDITALENYLADKPLPEKIQLSRLVASVSRPIQASEHPMYTLWKSYTKQLPTAADRVAEAKTLLVETNPVCLQSTAATIVLENMSGLATPFERVAEARNVLSCKVGESYSQAAADVILQNIVQHPKPYELHGALEDIIKSDAVSSETKLHTLKKATEIIDHIPYAYDRITFANRILKMEDAHGGDRLFSFKQHAKEVLFRDIGSTSGFDDYLYQLEDDPRAPIIEQQLTQAYGSINIGSDDLHAVKKWATAVNDLPNAEWRCAVASDAARKLLEAEVIESVPHGQEWKKTIADILLHDTPHIRSAAEQYKAYSSALKVLGKSPQSEEIGKYILDLKADKQNNLLGYLRLLTYEDPLLTLGMDHPLVQQAVEKTLASAQGITDPEMRMPLLVSTAFLADPHSPVAKQAAWQVMDFVAQLPTGEQITLTHDLLQYIDAYNTMSGLQGNQRRGVALEHYANALLATQQPSLSNTGLGKAHPPLPSSSEVFSAIHETNFHGAGGNANVYRLENRPEFAVREVHRTVDATQPYEAPRIIEDPAFRGKNYGQAVAQYANNVTLLRFQEGIPCGVPVYLRHDSANQAANDRMYEAHTEVAANMPHEAYVDLLADMQFLNISGKQIDPSKANNLLIDMTRQRFNLVDISTIDMEIDLHGSEVKYRQHYGNSVSHLINMTMDNYSHYYQGGQGTTLQQQQRVIYNKLIDAAAELHLPLDDNFLKYLPYFYPEDSSERHAVKAKIEAINQLASTAGQPDAVWNDPTFTLQKIHENPVYLKNASADIQLQLVSEDPSLLKFSSMQRELLHEHPAWFEHASRDMRGDAPFVKALASKNPALLVYATAQARHELLQADPALRETVLSALKALPAEKRHPIISEDITLMPYAEPDFQRNFVQTKPYYLSVASDAIQTEVIQAQPEEIGNASEHVRATMLERFDIKQTPVVLKFMPEHVQLAAVAENGLMLEHVWGKSKNKPEFIRAAAQNNPAALKFAGNNAFQKTLIAENPPALLAHASAHLQRIVVAEHPEWKLYADPTILNEAPQSASQNPSGGWWANLDVSSGDAETLTAGFHPSSKTGSESALPTSPRVSSVVINAGDAIGVLNSNETVTITTIKPPTTLTGSTMVGLGTVSQTYYNDIADKAKKASPTPRVKDRIAVMHQKGNIAFYEAFGDAAFMSKGVVSPILKAGPFTPGSQPSLHEMLHLFLRAPHVLEGGEDRVLPAQIALGGGHASLTKHLAPGNPNAQKVAVSAFMAEYFHDRLKAYEAKFGGVQPPADPTAAAYLYQQQLEFIRDYQSGDRDNTSATLSERYSILDHDCTVFLNAPDQLLELTDSERKAILQVALGVENPENTPFSKRLSAIQSKLEAAGISYRFIPETRTSTINTEDLSGKRPSPSVTVKAGDGTSLSHTNAPIEVYVGGTDTPTTLTRNVPGIMPDIPSPERTITIATGERDGVHSISERPPTAPNTHAESGGDAALELDSNVPRPGAMSRGTGSGVHGYFTYTGIMMMHHGLEMMQGEHRNVGLGLANTAVGGITAATGVAGVLEAITPGSLSQRTTQALQRSNIPVMAASCALEVLNAAPEDKMNAAVRSMTTTTSVFVAGDVVGSIAARGAALLPESAAVVEAGTVGGLVLPVLAAMGAGAMYDRGMTIQKMEAAHGNAMAALTPNDGYGHLTTHLVELQSMLTLAAFGDGLAKDAGGKVDVVNIENIKAMREHLTPEEREDMQTQCLQQAAALYDKEQLSMKAHGDLDLRSETEQRAARDEAIKQRSAKLVEGNLQGRLAMVELQRQAREDYIPEGTQLAFGEDGKILLEPINYKALRTVFTRMHDTAEKGVEKAQSTNYYWNMWDGQQKLGARFAAEALGKKADISLAELNSMQWKGGKDVVRTPEQTAADIRSLNNQAQAQAAANNGKQAIRVDYFYVENKDQLFVPVDNRNATLHPDAVNNYGTASRTKEGPPKHFAFHNVLYKKDSNGNDVPFGIAVYHIVNQEAMQKQEIAQGKEPHNYITDVKYEVKDYTTGTIAISKHGKAHNYEQDFRQLLETNKALQALKESATKADKDAYALAMKEANNLLSYFTTGKDIDGNSLTTGDKKRDDKLKDNIIDRTEYEAMVNDINTKLQGSGVTLTLTNATNLLAHTKPSGVQIQ